MSRRLFWVQIQGQFKIQPKGLVYLGGEVLAPMSLGFFTRSLTKLLLRIIKSVVAGLHFSFGQNEANENERPHISFPLLTSVDQFVVTKAGSGPPPTLGQMDFGETSAERKQRKKLATTYQYNTRDIYSFHFHSYFIDFDKWQVVNIPGASDMNLTDFWSDMPLNLVAYAVQQPQDDDGEHHASEDASRKIEKKEKVPKVYHDVSTLQYFFQFQLQPSSAVIHQEEKTEALDEPQSSLSLPTFVERNPELVSLDFQIPYWLDYFNVFTQNRLAGYVFHVSQDHSKKVAGEGTHRPLDSWTIIHTPTHAGAPVLEKLKKNKVKVKKGKLHRIEMERQLVEKELQTLMNSMSSSSIQQSNLVNLLTHNHESPASPDGHDNGRRSSFDFSMDLKGTIAWDFFELQLYAKSAADLNIHISSHLIPPGQMLYQDEVIRQIWDTYLRHEWMILTPTVLYWYSPNTSHPSLIVPLDSILDIHAVVFSANSESPDPHCSGESRFRNPLFDTSMEFLCIKTIYKVLYVGVSSIDRQERWLESIRFQIKKGMGANVVLRQQSFQQTFQQYYSTKESSQAGSSSRGNHEKFLAMFDAELNTGKYKVKRKILNSYDMYMNVTTVAGDDVRTKERLQETVATLLRRAVAMDIASTSTQDVLDFFTACAALKTHALSSFTCWSPLDKKSFLLNCYHLMIQLCHVLRLFPTSKLSWLKFFNETSLELGPNIVLSLAEIEHCLLRANMSTPRSKIIVSKFLPSLFDASKDVRAQLALGRDCPPDYRLNLVLNCMSNSCLEHLMIFDPTCLDAQMNAMCSLMMTSRVRIDFSKRTVFLPKICDWYRDDFGSSPIACLQKLERFFVGKSLSLVRQILVAKQLIHIKYCPYDFAFRERLKLITLREVQHQLMTE